MAWILPRKVAAPFHGVVGGGGVGGGGGGDPLDLFDRIQSDSTIKR